MYPREIVVESSVGWSWPRIKTLFNQDRREWGSVLLAYEKACLANPFRYFPEHQQSRRFLWRIQRTYAAKASIPWGLGLPDRFESLWWLVTEVEIEIIENMHAVKLTIDLSLFVVVQVSVTTRGKLFFSATETVIRKVFFRCCWYCCCYYCWFQRCQWVGTSFSSATDADYFCCCCYYCSCYCYCFFLPKMAGWNSLLLLLLPSGDGCLEVGAMILLRFPAN